MKLALWAHTYEHDKKYLICDNYESVNTLIKKQNSLINNLEAIRLFDIAYKVLINYYAKKGELKEINVISSDVQTVLLNNLIKEKKYSFIPKASICEKTISEVLDTINIIRSAHIIHNEFKEFNDLITSYEALLKEKGYFDEILLYKEAINILSTLEFNDNSHYAILDYVKEKLNYLEYNLIKALNKNVETIEIADENKSEKYHLMDVYGEANAIEKVIKDIKDKNLALNDCEIVLTTSAYEASVRCALESRGLKYSYTSNYSIGDNYGIKFIKDYLDWLMDDFSYDKFIKLMNNPNINLIEPIAILNDSVIHPYQLGIDAGISYGIDRYYDFLNSIIDIENRHKFIMSLYEHNAYFKEDMICDDGLDKFTSFIKEALSIIDDDILYKPGILLEKITKFYDSNAIVPKDETILTDKLANTIDALKMIVDTESFKESVLTIIDKLSKIGSIDTLAQDSIEVCNLDKVLIFIRKNVYVIGMNYDDFEPKLRDNPIISNKTLKKCLDSNYYINLSLNRSKEKKEIFLKSLSTFSGNSITFIMSSYNTKEFRPTPPSPIYNELKKKYGEEVCEKKYDNFIYLDENQILKYDVNKATSLKFVEEECVSGHKVYKLIKPLTASQLNTIMRCPLEYIYSLQYFSEDFLKRDACYWLSANEKGNLFHYVFEEYCKGIINVKSCDLGESVDKERFEKIFARNIEYFKKRVACPSVSVFEIEKQEYHDQMIRYLNMMHEEFKAHHIHVIKVESAFDKKTSLNKTLSIDENGNKYGSESSEELIISFSANTKVDREDYLENDDEIRIVDYKTTRTKYDNKKMKVNMQWFVYPFLEGASSFEYHFPCVNKEEDVFGETKKDFESLPVDVAKLLFDFFAKGKIDILDDEDDDSVCENCKYKGICIKKLSIKGGNSND